MAYVFVTHCEGRVSRLVAYVFVTHCEGRVSRVVAYVFVTHCEGRVSRVVAYVRNSWRQSSARPFGLSERSKLD